jgi:hypothetical protein
MTLYCFMTLFMVNKLFKLESMTGNVFKMTRFCHLGYESADNRMREVVTTGFHAGFHANMASVLIRTQITRRQTTVRTVVHIVMALQ